jgi:hypothetical protein
MPPPDLPRIQILKPVLHGGFGGSRTETGIRRENDPPASSQYLNNCAEMGDIAAALDSPPKGAIVSATNNGRRFSPRRRSRLY